MNLLEKLSKKDLETLEKEAEKYPNIIEDLKNKLVKTDLYTSLRYGDVMQLQLSLNKKIYEIF